MKKISLLLVAVAFIALSACSENSVSPTDAELTTVSKLEATPGFGWLTDELNNYQPNQDYIDQIRNSFQPSTQKFLIFVKPSCSCVGTHQQFPAFVKTMMAAGIPDSCYQIYAMTALSSVHPYQNMINLKQIPSFILMNNQQAVYSVEDTITTRSGMVPVENNTVEAVVAESLSNTLVK